VIDATIVLVRGDERSRLRMLTTLDQARRFGRDALVQQPDLTAVEILEGGVLLLTLTRPSGPEIAANDET
jgi:hypothetical protein